MGVGDFGALFKPDQMLFRTVCGRDEVRAKETLRKQLAALPATATEARGKIEKLLTMKDAHPGTLKRAKEELPRMK